EYGLDPAPGVADPGAARHPVAVDRQPERPADPETVPVNPRFPARRFPAPGKHSPKGARGNLRENAPDRVAQYGAFPRWRKPSPGRGKPRSGRVRATGRALTSSWSRRLIPGGARHFTENNKCRPESQSGGGHVAVLPIVPIPDQKRTR